MYRNVDAEELNELHSADRLMVKLIQIDRLEPRISAMLYRTTFDETWTLLSQSATKLIEAGQGILNAKNFKELLSVRASNIIAGSDIDAPTAYPAHWELHEWYRCERWCFRVQSQQYQ